MTPEARTAAAIDLLQAVEPSCRDRFAPPADRVVAEWFRARRYIGSKDRAAIHGRVYAILRARARIDWWIARGADAVLLQGLPFAASARSRVLAWLALGEGLGRSEIGALFTGVAYAPSPPGDGEQAFLDWLWRQPEAERGLDDPRQPPAVRHELPAWVMPGLNTTLGRGATDAEFTALGGPAHVDLRTNALKASRAQVQAVLTRDGVATTPTPWSPWGLRCAARPNVMALSAWKQGLFEIQDEGSQLVAALVAAQPGMRVVDFCAGAGGKTLAIAAAMGNTGRIMACDVSQPRGEASAQRLRRAGVDTVERRTLDSERDPWVKKHKASFDRVLVDAPCTGVGTWRRNPDGKWRLTPEDVTELVALQARILDSAARLVKPGGRLIYATCSLLPEENGAQVERFLGAAPGAWRVLPIGEVWAEALTGACPVPGPYLELTPHRHNTDGFFCAVLERVPVAAPVATAEPQTVAS